MTRPEKASHEVAASGGHGAALATIQPLQAVNVCPHHWHRPHGREQRGYGMLISNGRSSATAAPPNQGHASREGTSPRRPFVARVRVHIMQTAVRSRPNVEGMSSSRRAQGWHRGERQGVSRRDTSTNKGPG